MIKRQFASLFHNLGKSMKAIRATCRRVYFGLIGTRFSTMQCHRGLKRDSRDIRRPLIATYDGPLRPLGYLAI